MTTSLEVVNDSGHPVRPVCFLGYGSQVALVTTGDEVLDPLERRWISGRSEFLRPLDDYESGDAFCYTRPPRHLSVEISGAERRLTVGRPTQVPALIGKQVNSMMPNFPAGLDIVIDSERTPCTKKQLMKMSRNTPFGKPPCGDPIVVAQEPPSGTRARVGDSITITVAGR